jgi:hypothetical protein
MSISDRMKMFESQKSSKNVRKETVSQTERGGDIRSKISLWGNQTTTNNNYRVSFRNIFLFYFHDLIYNLWFEI